MVFKTQIKKLIALTGVSEAAVEYDVLKRTYHTNEETPTLSCHTSSDLRKMAKVKHLTANLDRRITAIKFVEIYLRVDNVWLDRRTIPQRVTIEIRQWILARPGGYDEEIKIVFMSSAWVDNEQSKSTWVNLGSFFLFIK